MKWWKKLLIAAVPYGVLLALSDLLLQEKTYSYKLLAGWIIQCLIVGSVLMLFLRPGKKQSP